MIERTILTRADAAPLPRLLLCRMAHLTAWTIADLSAPYWRCYVPLDPGGVVRWQRSVHRLQPGAALLIAPRTTASTVLRQPFRKAYLHAVWEPAAARSRPGVYRIPVSSSLCRALAQPDAGDELALRLMAVFSNALADLLPNAWETRPNLSPAIVMVKAHLDRHWLRPPGNTALGRLVGLHPHSLVRRFTAEVGCAPQTYAMSRRLDTAAERLTASDEPIETILDDLGFHDRSHFTRLFRRHWGCPPAEYRRRQGG